MTILLAGIDEAGYGPMLGPLCVGLSVFRLAEAAHDDAVDLWTRLSRGVCRSPGDARRRIAVADSKKLKTGGSVAELERTALCFLARNNREPTTDLDLLDTLGASLAPRWYSGDPRPIPVEARISEIKTASNLLRTAMATASVEVVALRCATLDEHAFNSLVASAGTKAACTQACLGGHLRCIFDIARAEPLASNPSPTTHVRVTCDRLGGRAAYAPLLRTELPDARIDTLEESHEASRYSLHVDGVTGVIEFRVRAEDASLPVALASILAKYTRELAMTRFNAYWQSRCPALKPTAGYVTDARRWLDDLAAYASPAEIAAMVRTR